jgi:hypothetical protein
MHTLGESLCLCVPAVACSQFSLLLPRPVLLLVFFDWVHMHMDEPLAANAVLDGTLSTSQSEVICFDSKGHIRLICHACSVVLLRTAAPWLIMAAGAGCMHSMCESQLALLKWHGVVQHQGGHILHHHGFTVKLCQCNRQW